MTIARIRRLVLKIVTAFEPEADDARPASPVSARPVRAPAPQRAVAPGAGNDRHPWISEMAAPSFMILSVRPRR
ncbi:hypothetical protein ACIPUC_36145 [Streptomyces sp. LARHCF249]